MLIGSGKIHEEQVKTLAPPMRSREEIKYIVLHHSATDSGNVEVFRKEHVEKNGWWDVGYHFVICNGRGGEDGEVQIGRDIAYWGAHCIPRNADSIGICLVGNFENYPPTVAQYEAVAGLVADLCRNYPIEAITPHNAWDVTLCPGKKFDLDLVVRKAEEILRADYVGHWAEEDIRWVLARKIMTVDELGKFYPNRGATRAELAAVLHRFARKYGLDN